MIKLSRFTWTLIGVLTMVGVWKLADAQTPSHCAQGTVTQDVVSYGVATRTQACVLDLKITAGNVAVRSQGDGIFRSSFN